MRIFLMNTILVFILTFCCFVVSSDADDGIESLPTRSSTIIVDKNGSGDFTGIQDAINNSVDGDVIRIWDGIYNERIEVNRSVTIIGNSTSSTSISGSGTHILITSDHVNISGISISGGSSAFTIKGEFVLIENCKMSGYYNGILVDADDATIRRCYIEDFIQPVFVNSIKFRTLIDKCTISSGSGEYSTIDLYGIDTVFTNNTLVNTILDLPFYYMRTYDITKNELNGLPIIFYKYSSDITIDEEFGQLFLYECSRIDVKDIELVGLQDAIMFNNCDNITIDEIEINGTMNRGILFLESRDVSIKNSRFLNLDDAFITKYVVARFTVENSSFKNMENGLKVEDGTISGLTVKNNLYDNVSDPNWVYGNDISVEDNTVIDCGFIVQAVDSEGIVVRNNYCTNVNVTHGWGYGPSLVRCDDCLVEGNNISRKSDGINCRESTNVIIRENEIYSTSEGVIVGSSAKVYNNYFHRNSKAVSVLRGSDVEIKNNLIYQCIKTGAGIYLFESSDYLIFNNTIKDSQLAINNQDSSGGLITHNYFIDNDQQVTTTGTDKWYSDWPSYGNFWSDYSGNDVKNGRYQDQYGSDGIGDSAYLVAPSQSDRYPIFIDTVDPVAGSRENVTLEQGNVYPFSLTNCSDDQMIVKAVWEFHYDGEDKIIDLMEFDFLFNVPGVYEVNMTVYDFAGNHDNDQFTITVIDTIAPIIVTQGNITQDQNTLVYFNATGSTDNGMIMNYTWMFTYGGSNVTMYGSKSSFRFDLPGYYKVRILVTDQGNNTAFSTFYVNITDTEDPDANAGVDIEINNGGTLDLDGSSSTDNGVIVSYYWSFEYDDIVVHLEGITRSFVFDVPGHYNITLAVTDAYGNIGFDVTIITVIDTLDPVPVITGSLNVLEGEQLSLDGTDSTDNGRIVRYVWTFNDTEEKSVEGAKLTYDFQKKGFHEITLTVYDEWNNSASKTVTVEIVDTTHPTADAGEDITVPAGTTVTFNGSGSSDDGSIVKWEWSFDYNGENKEILGESAEFTFDIPGKYSILITVFDQSGNFGEDTMTITVTGPVDDDDDVVGDDDVNGKNKEFPFLVVSIIGIGILLLIVGLIVFIIIKKKQPEEGKTVEEEKDRLDDMLDSLPPENTYPTEQDSIVPPDPDPFQEQENIFGEYDLPETSPNPIAEPSLEE